MHTCSERQLRCSQVVSTFYSLGPLPVLVHEEYRLRCVFELGEGFHFPGVGLRGRGAVRVARSGSGTHCVELDFVHVFEVQTLNDPLETDALAPKGGVHFNHCENTTLSAPWSA